MHFTFISFAILSAYSIFLLVLSGKAIWFGYDLWNNWSVSMMYIVPKMGKICSIEINVCQWIFIHFRPSFFVSRFHFGSGCCQLMNKLSGQFSFCVGKKMFLFWFYQWKSSSWFCHITQLMWKGIVTPLTFS